MLRPKQQLIHEEDAVAENKSPNFGKPWADHSVHNTHDAARVAKESLENESLQVKIRRTPENRFRVRTRSTVVSETKETKSTSNTAKPAKSRSARRKEKAARHKARQEKG